MSEIPTQRRSRTPQAHPAQPEGYTCPLSGDFVNKLEQLLNGQAEHAHALEDLTEKVDKLQDEHEGTKDKVAEMYRAIRGYNGTPGMVTDVTLLKEQISELSEKVELVNDRNVDKDVHDTKREVAKDATPTFKEWILEKALIPVVTAVLIWLLVTVLPSLIAHLGMD